MFLSQGERVFFLGGDLADIYGDYRFMRIRCMDLL